MRKSDTITRAGATGKAGPRLTQMWMSCSYTFVAALRSLRRSEEEDKVNEQIDLEFQAIPGEDADLAALHVAKLVGICFQGRGFRSWLENMRLESQEVKVEVSNDKSSSRSWQVCTRNNVGAWLGSVSRMFISSGYVPMLHFPLLFRVA
jgi:hypothetical protein